MKKNNDVGWTARTAKPRRKLMRDEVLEVDGVVQMVVVDETW